MKTVALYSSKGGVGKTAASVNLAFQSAKMGNKTLLIDLDQQAASGFYFRIRPPKSHRAGVMMDGKKKAEKVIRETDYPNLHLLPAHTSYRNFDTILDGMKRSKSRLSDLVAEVSQGYDRVIIDCPPTLSYVAENIFRSVDLLMVPLVPTTLSLRTYDQLKDFFDDKSYKKKKLRPFFSMVEKRKRMHIESMRQLRENEKRVFKTEVPYCAQVEAMGIEREPVLQFAPRHAASVAFRKLWNEMEEK